MAQNASDAIPSLAANKKIHSLLVFLSLIALCGVGLNIALTQHFYDIRNGTAGFQSFCNLGEVANCDVIAASSYAELIAGVPIAAFGAGWFLALFFTSLVAYNRYWRREAVRACFGLTAFGTLLSAGYLLIMVGILKTYCLLCLGVDVLVVSALVLVCLMKPETLKSQPLDRSKWKMLIGIAATSLIVSVFGLRSLDSAASSGPEAEKLAERVLSTPPVTVPQADHVPSFGPENAPIKVVEFSDYQCPHCRIGAMVVNSVINRYPGKVRVEFRNFPLDQKCNPSVQHAFHTAACESAQMSLCASQQGKFKEAYEQLFENQAGLAPGRPLELAKKLGIDTEKMQSCMNSQPVALAIEKDLSDGHLLGISGTPVFFINGHKMEGPYPMAAWTRIIDTLLKK